MAMGWPVRTARAVAGKRSMSSTWPTTLVVQPVAVGADETTELVVLQREDVAVGGADRLPEALGQRREDGLEVVCLRRDRTQLDDVAEHGRPLLELLHKEGALERSGDVCAVLRRKLRYSEKSRSRVS